MAGPAQGGSTARASLEVERKYDVPPDLAVPDLALGELVVVGEPVVHQLEATYFDTEATSLRRAGITLRHRTGGTDAGWHLKLPAGKDREELTVSAPPDEVPEALATLVRAHVRRSELLPVAQLSTRRVVRQLLDPSGQSLAELADDTVTGRPLGRPDGAADEELVWREWEVELLGGDRSVLDEVERALLDAGAAPAGSGSKVGRVLSRVPAPQGAVPWWATGPGQARQTTAGGAVRAHLAEQVAELLVRDPQARRDVPDGVHRMRVATRRLRSALATFRPLLDRAQTDPLRDELRWLAGVLGGARDAEVMHERLRALVADEPPELVLGKVLDRVDTVMSRRHREAHEHLREQLDGDRYLDLLDALDALVAAPPFHARARGDAAKLLAKAVRRTWRRLERAMDAAERARPGAAQDALLHEVRKDAKRVRYAAESVQPVFGPPARRFAKAVADLQESLGDFQDGVVTREVLRQLGAAGHAAGENGFTFGRLHALEQVRAEAAVARWPQARAAVSRRRLRRWFDG